MTLRSAVPHLLTMAACLMLGRLGAETAVPMATPDFAQHRTEIEGRSYLQNDLGGASGYHVRGTRRAGSDQSFEWDTFVHTGADSPYVFGGIFNAMTKVGSHVGDLRTLGGADIHGTVDVLRTAGAHVEVHDAGRVGAVMAFEVVYNTDRPTQIGQRYSFVDTDHTSIHELAGTTQDVDVLKFSNGWSLRVNGDSLELWDAKGLIRPFR